MKPRHVQQVVETYGTPTYVYDETRLEANLKRIIDAKQASDLSNDLKIHVPYFVNSHPRLFQIITRHAGITVQSVEEYHQLREHNLTENVIVSPTHLADDHLAFFTDNDVPINAGTIDNLKSLLQRGATPRCRVDLSPQNNQRQNIRPDQFDDVKAILDHHDEQLHGIHIYPGTKNKLDVHLRYQRRSLQCLNEFHALDEINLGGGFKYEYEDEDTYEDRHFDWATYFDELAKRCDEYNVPDDVTFVIEPGRDVLVDAGHLVLTVNHVQRAYGTNRYEVFTDGSYVHMPSANIRPREHRQRYYTSSYEEIREDRYDGKPALLSGNTTLSSDRVIPKIVHIPKELSKGDHVVLNDVGAYCATQHLEFLNKRPPAEALITDNGDIEKITERGPMADKTRHVT